MSLEDLTNARALYNSRRYPLRFALSEETTKKRKHTERAIYDPTQGCMCPLLDVLNHQSSTDVLRFQVTDSTLNIIANQTIQEGDEIFSNYDYANNDPPGGSHTMEPPPPQDGGGGGFCSTRQCHATMLLLASALLVYSSCTSTVDDQTASTTIPGRTSPKPSK